MNLFKILISILFTGFYLQFACGQGLASVETKIDAYLQPYIDMNSWSGVISISKEGTAVFRKSYGYADQEWGIPNSLDTKFRIASISKVFTEVAILKLIENKNLSLDDRLNQFIVDYPRGDEISIKQLLNHRSGIPHLNSYPNYNELNKLDWELKEVIDLFKAKPLDFEPGERYSYSNSGYVLLAFIIENISGVPFETYLQREIFTEVGLSNTGIDDDKELLEKRARGYMFDEEGSLINAEYVNMSIKIGGGSLYSTINDLDLFVQSLLDKRILKSTLSELPNFGEINGEQVFTANGRVQGFCHQITHRINEDLTIIVLGNHYSNIALPISEDIYKILNNEAYKIPENYLDQIVELPVEVLAGYEGSYDFGFGPVGEVKIIDNGIGYRAPGRKKFDKLVPLGKDRFFYIQSWVLLQFRDNQADRYQTLDWIMGENTYPASRISKN